MPFKPAQRICADWVTERQRPTSSFGAFEAIAKAVKMSGSASPAPSSRITAGSPDLKSFFVVI
jgi:hypothetical protein